MGLGLVARRRRRPIERRVGAVRTLLDTHFLLWILLQDPRLEEFPWLDSWRPWGVSPVSWLEIQFLTEIGRIEQRRVGLFDVLRKDRRFIVDEVPLLALIEHALPIAWTRDPFDRLLAAHSSARRVPLSTVDRRIRENHRFLVPELEP
jgi:PIN domain nuclease of toxin-antitoxin system